jgi:hypothetical protein
MNNFGMLSFRKLLFNKGTNFMHKSYFTKALQVNADQHYSLFTVHCSLLSLEPLQ